MRCGIISLVEYGRLAQLVEHLLDVQGVRDSSSLTSTKIGRILPADFYLYLFVYRGIVFSLLKK